MNVRPRPVRLAHIVSHPIQYFAPLYREIARRPEVDLTVFFCSDAGARPYRDAEFGREVSWDTALLEGFRSRTCASARGRSPDNRRPNWDIVREVASGGFDAIWVHGYAHPTMWLALAAAGARGARLLLREEQTLLHPRPRWKCGLRHVALQALFRHVTALYIGEQNRRFFERHGMPEERLFPARYCVDNAFFREKAAELTPRRAELRASFGIEDDAPVVLYAGKLVEKKQPLMLLDAFARVRRHHPCWLLVAGDGELREPIEDFVVKRGMPDVRLAGFLNQTQLPSAYASADMLVLPSGMHETWGLVVNEAMNFGLPVVVTDKVGCAEDLVRHDWNGFVVPRHDVRALAGAIETLVENTTLRASFGARSRELVALYSMEACADGIIRAVVATGAANQEAMLQEEAKWAA